MFNSNDTEAYHAIKAPAALKESILSELADSKRRRTQFPSRAMISRMSAIAACLLLVFCTVSAITLSSSPISLSYRDSEIGKDRTAVTIPAVMPISMRARTTGISIPLTLEVERKTDISIEGGSVCRSEISLLDTSLTLEADSGRVELLIFPDLGTPSCTITVKSGLSSESYILELDENSSGYVIYKK